MINPTGADIGRIVVYVPGHAHDDLGHPDCERGAITSFNDHCVFVRYRATALNGTATNRQDLYFEDGK